MVKDYTPDLSPVLGVRQELEQVLPNLLANAWHGMPDGGTITTTQRRDVQVVIIIAELGCSILAEHMNRLFELFFTTTPPRTRHRPGTSRGASADHRAWRPYRYR